MVVPAYIPAFMMLGLLDPSLGDTVRYHLKKKNRRSSIVGLSFSLRALS
jgi:hypothetical protein